MERCDTQSSQRDSEEVNSVEVLCPCFQLRQTRLSHEHNTSLLSKRRFSKVWIFHDDAWLDSRGWFCLYLPDCHFCLQLYRISAIAKSVKSQNETRHKRQEGKDLGCQRLKKKLFWIDLENFLFGRFQKCWHDHRKAQSKRYNRNRTTFQISNFLFSWLGMNRLQLLWLDSNWWQCPGKFAWNSWQHYFERNSWQNYWHKKQQTSVHLEYFQQPPPPARKTKGASLWEEHMISLDFMEIQMEEKYFEWNTGIYQMKAWVELSKGTRSLLLTRRL